MYLGNRCINISILFRLFVYLANKTDITLFLETAEKFF